ncbi:hypothetical protein RI054_02g07790 [Pseudoscourfieldia marina]
MFDYKGHVTKSTKGALHFQHFTLQCKGYMFTSCHKITSTFNPANYVKHVATCKACVTACGEDVYQQFAILAESHGNTAP